jgi:hypothetical protein
MAAQRRVCMTFVGVLAGRRLTVPWDAPRRNQLIVVKLLRKDNYTHELFSLLSK